MCKDVFFYLPTAVLQWWQNKLRDNCTVCSFASVKGLYMVKINTWYQQESIFDINMSDKGKITYEVIKLMLNAINTIHCYACITQQWLILVVCG